MLPPGFFAWIKLAGLLAIVLALAAAYVHVRTLSAEAARVPALSQQIASNEARANALSGKLAAADAARRAADDALSAWQAQKAATLETIGKEEQNAPASRDPACAPRDIDRWLRNDALGRLTRFDEARGAARLP